MSSQDDYGIMPTIRKEAFFTGIVYLTSISISLMLALFALKPSIRIYAQPLRYYAGYMIYGPNSNGAPWGIGAQIHTINPTVPYNDIMFEWVTVILSYTNNWWLQVGYHKEPSSFSGLRFYYEVVTDSVITHYHYPTGPSTNARYSYQIVHRSGNIWNLLVRNSNANTIYDTRVSIGSGSYSPQDLQAFAETTTSVIRLDGTHFRCISYYDGRSFPLWNTHVYFFTPPYALTQVFHSEFYASGGG